MSSIKKPTVSVAMSTYNENEGELRAAVESILNQSYSDLEFIIVIDNPENEMINRVVTEYERFDSRVKVLKNEKNIGLVSSLNRAISEASGEYIARMDADDVSVACRLERELAFLSENGLDMVSALKKDIDESGNVIREHYLKGMLPDEVNKKLPSSPFIVHSSVIFKKELWERAGGYRQVRAAEDYDLWLRFLSLGARMGLIDEYLLLYRVRANSITSNNSYRQVASTLFIQKCYKNGTLNDTDFLAALEKWNDSNGVNSKARSDRFSVRFDRMRRARSEQSRIKKLFMACRVGLSLLADPILREYVCRALNNRKNKKS